MSLFFGFVSMCLFSYGAGVSYSNFCKENEKNKQLRSELNFSIVDFTERHKLGTNKGIVKMPIKSDVYYYSICKLLKTKNVEVKQLKLCDGSSTDICIDIPVATEKLCKKFVNSFVSDETFGEKCCKQLANVKFLFSNLPTSRVICDGKYLQNLLKSQCGTTFVCDVNNELFELSTKTISPVIFLFGKNNEETFDYTHVSNNKNLLIEKIVDESSLTSTHVTTTALCAIGIGLSALKLIVSVHAH